METSNKSIWMVLWALQNLPRVNRSDHKENLTSADIHKNGKQKMQTETSPVKQPKR
jgi:hypothetical protein